MSALKLSFAALALLLVLVVTAPPVEGFGGMLRRSPTPRHAEKDDPNDSNVGAVKVMGIEQEICDRGCPYDPKAANCTTLKFQFDHCYNVVGFKSGAPSLSSEALFILSANLNVTLTQFRPYTCVDRRGGARGSGHPLPPHFTFRFASVPSGIPPSPTSECAAIANYTSPVTEMIGNCFPIAGNKFVLNRCWMVEGPI